MMMAEQVMRPAPLQTEDNHSFWDAAREHRLVAQECSGCGKLRHPPRPACPHCHSLDYRLRDLRGVGVVYSYSILHHPQNPSFVYPVIAALIDLDEGIRLVSNLVDVIPEDVKIGMRVAVTYMPTRDDGVVPVFRPSEAEGE